MGKSRLLVVEDDNDISNMLKIYFTSLGYDVDVAPRGIEALEKTRTVIPHLIVLDIMLPDIDGYEVCRKLRQSTRSSHIPVIFLTQKDERSDKLQGLELGADDYITKPFNPREVVARVRTVLRRSTPAPEPSSLITIGALSIDPLKHEVQLQGRSIDLTPSEFNILLVMASQPGRAFSRMELLDAAQGEAYEGYERSIDVHIKNLRQKLGDEPRDPTYILTVYGVGYKFSDKVH
jgi:DNA-binding response OmpR family regulator